MRPQFTCKVTHQKFPYRQFLQIWPIIRWQNISWDTHSRSARARLRASLRASKSARLMLPPSRLHWHCNRNIYVNVCVTQQRFSKCVLQYFTSSFLEYRYISSFFACMELPGGLQVVLYWSPYSRAEMMKWRKKQFLRAFILMTNHR